MRAIAVGLALLASAGSARADIESELVKSGMKAYEELDYPKAVADLEKALAESLTKEERVATYRTLAFAHVALDDAQAAKADFGKLLKVDPAFQLDNTISPRIRTVFDEAKAQAGPAPSTVMQEVTVDLLPAKPEEGAALTLSTYLPGGVAVLAQLFYRARGQASFSKVSTEGHLGRFEAVVPGMDVKAPGMEYYLRILDDKGAALGGVGSEAQPFSVEVAPRKGAPVGLIAAVAGVVVLVGAIVGVVVGVAASKPRPDAPSMVTFQPL